MIVLSLVAILFIGCTALVVHTYFGYPVSLWAMGASPKPKQTPRSFEEFPSVSLIISAYNEEDVIAEKIENSLELEYPDECLEIIVASDASDDRTDEIVRSFRDQGVRLERIEGRVGKTQCQNEVVAMTDSDIVVFSDANSMYDRDAIYELVNRFSEGIGCVAGELRYQSQDDTEGESVYWRYEQLLKRLESDTGSLVAGNGSIYAVRRSSYVPLSAEAISDFAEPLAVVSNGEQVKYAPCAVAREYTGESTESELDRRIRIVTRCWHTVADYSDLLNPLKYPSFAYKFLSHKIVRWLSPALLGISAGTNAILAIRDRHPVYLLTLTAQIAFYGAAGIGYLRDRRGKTSPTPIHVPYYFVLSNYGMLVGLWNFLRGENIVTWDTADREEEGTQ